MVKFTEKEIGMIICAGTLGLFIIHRVLFELAKVILL